MRSSFRDQAGATLAPSVVALLEVAAKAAQEQGGRLFAVGGLVRDVLLGRATEDVDLVLVGPAESLVARLATALPATIEAESRFRTWRLALADGRRLDLAEARSESYPEPGALPRTRPGSLEEDLARRDFTVNAMAVALTGTWGPLIDPHQGRADLEQRVLRVLHAGSFVDDPTRILRGLELSVRLGFDFEDGTARAARQALATGALDTLSPARFRSAWRRAFGRLLERGPRAVVSGLELASGLGLLAALDPSLRLDAAARARSERLASLPEGPAERSELLLRALVWDDGELARRVGGRSSAEPALATAWGAFGRKLSALRAVMAGAQTPRVSQIAAALEPFEAAERELLALAADGAFDALLAVYRDRVLGFELAISGHDLLAAGEGSGPALGRALAATRAARLDGVISEEQELEYARQRLEADSA